MSKEQMTKKLYAQLREARMRHNDAEALAVLNQIIAADPTDQNARAQAAELSNKAIVALTTKLEVAVAQGNEDAIHDTVQQLESLVPQTQLKTLPIYTQVKASLVKKNSMHQATVKNTAGAARTKLLYRQFREAQRARQDEKAFDLLKEILSIDSTDDDARSQSVEIGKRLSAQKAPELSRLLRAGDIEPLSEMVGRMNQWADKNFLSTLPDYSAADTLVTAMRRKKVMGCIEERFAKLRQNPPSLEEQENEASEIEKLATEYGIIFESDEQAFLRRIHNDYGASQTLIKQEKKAAEISEEIDEINRRIQLCAFKNDVEIEQVIARLDFFSAESGALDYITAQRDEICSRINASKLKLHQLLKKRTIKARVICAITLLFISGCGLLLHAHGTAPQSVQEIILCMESKNVNLARELVQSKTLGTFCKELVSTDYEQARLKLARWVAQYDKLLDKARAMTMEMQMQAEKLDASSISYNLELIKKMASLHETLAKNYNWKMSDDDSRRWTQFQESLVALKNVVLAKYQAPPQKATLSELRDLFAEFRKNAAIFNFTEDEHEEVHRAISSVARDILLYKDQTKVPSENDIERSLDFFREYSESLMLDNSIQNKLNELRNAVQQYKKLDNKLQKASTIGEYARTLSVITILKPYMPDVCDANEVSLITSKLCSELAFEHALSNSKLRFNKETLPHSLLEKILDIFQTRGKDAYMGFPPAIRSCIDAITEENNKLWNNDYDEVVSDTGKVYIGKTSKINDKLTIIKYQSDGTNTGEVVRLEQGSYTKKRMKIATMREDLGFRRIDLQRSSTPPADLLHRIASEGADIYPQFARAWLFKQTIDLMDSFTEPLANGMAFSPSMTADVTEFLKLASKHNLRPGCWLDTHSAKQDKEFYDFFAKAAKHNYHAEIESNLSILLKSTLSFVGFVDSDGRFVCKENQDAKLYYISFGGEKPTLTPALRGRVKPYTPLFTLE